MTSPTPTAKATLSLFQTTLCIGDRAPEGGVFADEAAAHAAIAVAARDYLKTFWQYAPEILSDAGSPEMGLDLAAISDDDVVKLANAWDGVTFESVVEPVKIDVDVDVITTALQAAGAAVVVYQATDVADLMKPDADAGRWLAANGGELQSCLAQHGQDWICRSLEREGMLRAPEWIVVENAGYNGERDLRSFPTWKEADTWAHQQYDEDEFEKLHVDIRRDSADGMQTYEFS